MHQNVSTCNEIIGRTERIRQPTAEPRLWWHHWWRRVQRPQCHTFTFNLCFWTCRMKVTWLTSICRRLPGLKYRMCCVRRGSVFFVVVVVLGFFCCLCVCEKEDPHARNLWPTFGTWPTSWEPVIIHIICSSNWKREPPEPCPGISHRTTNLWHDFSENRR